MLMNLIFSWHFHDDESAIPRGYFTHSDSLPIHIYVDPVPEVLAVGRTLTPKLLVVGLSRQLDRRPH
jgi:hypothetical protein